MIQTLLTRIFFLTTIWMVGGNFIQLINSFGLIMLMGKIVWLYLKNVEFGKFLPVNNLTVA